MSAAEALSAPMAGLRVERGGNETPLSRPLVREHRLNLYVDGAPYALLVCTRSQLPQLVLGRLCTDGRVAAAEDVRSLEFSALEDEAHVSLRSGAGSGGMRVLTDRSNWRSEDIFRLAAYKWEAMPLHDATAGTHGSLLLRRGEVLCCCEDIGRHNAIDKAVGAALTDGVPLSECVLYTTGRIAVDIVRKAAAAGVPVLASRALPTAEAVLLAKDLGLTLIGRAWEDRYELFTL